MQAILMINGVDFAPYLRSDGLQQTEVIRQGRSVVDLDGTVYRTEIIKRGISAGLVELRDATWYRLVSALKQRPAEVRYIDDQLGETVRQFYVTGPVAGAKTVRGGHTYFSGETFDPTGMAVTASYSNGATLAATGYAVEPAGPLTDGVDAVTVRYTEGGRSAAAAQPITVTHRLSGISVETPPSKTEYQAGEVFDPAGMVVLAAYSDGASAAVTGCTVPTEPFTAPGDQQVTVTYTENGVTAFASVSVTVARLVIENVPSQSGSPAYTGEPVTPEWENYNPAQLAIGGVTSAVNAGEYVAAFTPTESYQWSDGATGAKSVPWSIGKAAGSVSVSPATVTASFVMIYGVEWDWTSGGPTKGTRTDAAANFPDPSPAVNNGAGSSPFDSIMPWAGMVKETRAGGVEVKEPKYWFKWTKTGKKLKLQIANSPVEGFHVDPVNMDRGDGLGELDFSYIGRYHCATSTYKLETNKAQQVSITRRTARTNIHKLGANFWQMDFAQMWYVGMLYLVEFADWNGQATIGYGCSASGSRENNGKTDAMQYHTGTTAANRTTYGFTQYRNIEGWWDNVFDWMDGCYCGGSGLSVILNPNQYSDSVNGTLVGTPTGGYPSEFTIPTANGLEWALFPCAAAGSTTKYVPDSWGLYGSDPCLYHGGYYSQNQNLGPFCVDYYRTSYSHTYVGCRLWERPPKAAQ